MNVPWHNCENTTDCFADCVWFHTPPTSSQQTRAWRLELRICPEPINVARNCAEGQTVIDWLNIELEGVVAEGAEPEAKARRQEVVFAELDNVDKASHIRRLRRARCVDDLWLLVISTKSGWFQRPAEVCGDKSEPCIVPLRFLLVSARRQQNQWCGDVIVSVARSMRRSSRADRLRCSMRFDENRRLIRSRAQDHASENNLFGPSVVSVSGFVAGRNKKRKLKMAHDNHGRYICAFKFFRKI
jgi:hypothetical protein